MLQLSNTKKYKRKNSESGVYILMTAIALIGLIAVGGFALDAANIYLSRLRLVKALDAAVLGGLGYRIRTGLTAATADIENRAKELATSNIALTVTNLKGTPTYTATYQPGDPAGTPSMPTLTVTGTISVRLYLINSIPGSFGKFLGNVTATSVGRINPANISLVLDTSNSMACTPSGDCSCLTLTGFSGAPACSATLTKANILKEAAIEFAAHFDPTFDKISVIPFNLDAKRAMSLGDTTSPPATKSAKWISSIETALDINTLGLWTNPSDGLLTALVDARTNAPVTQRTSYILFTDGAPTAGRFQFADTEALETSPAGLTSYDYIHYAVFNSASANSSMPFGYYGPGPLLFSHQAPTSVDSVTGVVDSDPDASNPNFGYKGAGGVGIPQPPGWSDTTKTAPGVPTCSTYTETRRDYDQVLFNSNFGQAKCLNSLSFYGAFSGTNLDVPPSMSAPIGSAIPIPYDNNYPLRYEDGGAQIVQYSTNATQDPEHFLESYYNVAIAYSDFIRYNKGVIYSIGMGPTARTASTDDPYQNVYDVIGIKDNFLKRIAMGEYNPPVVSFSNVLASTSPDYIRNTTSLAAIDSTDATISTGVPDVNPDSLNPSQRGLLAILSNPATAKEDIKPVFEAFALDILMRLIQ